MARTTVLHPNLRSRVTLAWALAIAAGLLISGVAIAAHHEASEKPNAQPGGLAKQLASGDRPEADKARDAGRKPAGVVAFLGITQGMKVIDLIAAGGYYTEVLSVAVGPAGTVYAQNPEFVLKMREGANDKALGERLANDRLPNVVRLDRPLEDTGLAPGSLDAAITALNFHDVYNGSGREAAAGFLATVYGLLAPGGVLGVIDHDAKPGTDAAKLHRMEASTAIALAEAAGFSVEQSGLLRNPEDDRTQNVFAPGLRGHTDRFLLKLTKPL